LIEVNDQLHISVIKTTRSKVGHSPKGVPVQDQDHTTTTDGAMRNHFSVDILWINGYDFKGRINCIISLKLIFVQALGFAPIELAGIIWGFKGNPPCSSKPRHPSTLMKSSKGSQTSASSEESNKKMIKSPRPTTALSEE
jgi:hypothetical protein